MQNAKHVIVVKIRKAKVGRKGVENLLHLLQQFILLTKFGSVGLGERSEKKNANSEGWR